jgi:(2Fe-2S) ferredoxin
MSDTWVLVCQNVDCKGRGGAELFEELKSLLKNEKDIHVKEYMCFGACERGPNIVVYPARVFYSGVQYSDLDEIAEHAKGGPPVERLTHDVDPALSEMIYQLLDAGLF